MISLLGLLTFGSMLVLGFVFEEERTTFVDIAFHLYVQATTGEVAIQNYRFVSAISQWLPTQLMKAEVEMSTVQLVYSLLFPLFYGSIWGISNFILKAKKWALAWALIWLTFATHTHYWIQSELPQGLVLLVFALALMRVQFIQRGARIFVVSVIGVLLIVVSFAHPLLLIPVVFSFGLKYLCMDFPKKQLGIYAGIYLLGFILKSTVFRTHYDSIASGGIKIGLQTLLKGEIPYSILHFIENLTTTYYLLPLVSVIGVWTLWKSGKKLAAGWTFIAIVGHISLVALAYSSSDTQDFYIENLYLPAGFIAASGFAYGLFSIKKSRLSLPLTIGIFALVILRVYHIGWTGNSVYAPRLTHLKEMLNQYKDQRVIIKETSELQQDLIMTWGTGYEAWLIGARNKEPTPGFLIHKSPKDLRIPLEDPKRLILNFHQPLYSELPEKYFTRPNLDNKYIEVN